MGTFGKVGTLRDADDTPRGATFGAFSLDFRAQVLHKHGIRLKVSPQTLRVLICLVENAPNLVEREHLFELLWPGDTHVDFTGNLNAIIRDLRVLLGDSARQPRYIQTELRRGYRFIAPVGLLEPTTERIQSKGNDRGAATLRTQPATAATTTPSHSQWRWPKALGAGVAALLAILALRQWLTTRTTSDRLLPRVTPLTSLSGRAGHATLSPDGSKVAFHWDGNESGGFDIFIGDLEHEKFVRLTHDPADDLYPAWSPDGRDVAFLRRFPNGRCSIYLVAAEGGSERLIRDVPTESSLSWSSDGGWLAYTVLFKAAPKASSPDFGVYAVSLLTGQVVRLTSPPKNVVGDEDGTFSPDGRRIAFFRSSSMGVSDLYVQELDASKNPVGRLKRITFEGQNSRNPAWTPDGSKIIFSSLRAGGRSLWEVPFKEHGEPVQLGGENAQQPVFDRTGNRIVYERITVSDTLQVLPLCGSEACRDVQPHRLAYSREVARNPSWSPDGKQIVFESSEHGKVQVWRCLRDGSNPVVLSSFDAPLSGTPRWGPDGNSIVMDSSVKGHSKIFLVNVPSGKSRQLTSGDWEDVTPSFSHDGKTVYFASNRSGEFQVWKLVLATGSASQITQGGGFYAVESADEKNLLYTKGIHSTEIAQVPVSGGNENTVVGSLSYWPDFAVSPSGIYFVPAQRSRGGVPIWFHRFSDGKDVEVFQVTGVDLQGMALAPDNRELLLSVRTSAETNLMALSFSNANK